MTLSGKNRRGEEDPTASNIAAISRMEKEARSRRTMGDRISDHIARFCGSMIFVRVHVIRFTGWILMNSLPVFHAFDPYPFTFPTLVVSPEAIFLSTFILISQNAENRLTESRNNLDVQINLLAERENTETLALLARIARHLGLPLEEEDAIVKLEEAVEPDKLAERIESAHRKARDPVSTEGGSPLREVAARSSGGETGIADRGIRNEIPPPFPGTS